MSLPDKLMENWQESPSDLFKDISPKSFDSALDDGTIIQLKLQIHDQLENEIFFPTVKLAKDDDLAKTIEQLTVFRENLSIPGTDFKLFLVCKYMFRKLFIGGQRRFFNCH